VPLISPPNKHTAPRRQRNTRNTIAVARPPAFDAREGLAPAA
jgi:hypothetical protein